MKQSSQLGPKGPIALAAIGVGAKSCGLTKRCRAIGVSLVAGLVIATVPLGAQTASADPVAQNEVELARPSGAEQSGAPITVTLKDALDRARKLDPQLASADADAKSAHDDRLQARNSLLPNVSAFSQYMGTEGNGHTPDGRFVTQDGVHVYRDWLVIKQDLSPSTLFMRTGFDRAAAAEALAKAKDEIARRGLTVTVTKTFYTLVVAQRKYATAQQSRDQAHKFLQISQDLERGGQAAHSDVIKAEIQAGQADAAFDEARLAMESARLDLAVILFPNLNENYTVVDDLDSAQVLPTFNEVQTMASRDNPDLRAAIEGAREADLDVGAAKAAFLPTIGVEGDYGIEANQFALYGTQAAFAPTEHPDDVHLPNYGYFVNAILTVPLWDWGTLRSKLHQAEYRQETAKLQLSATQRTMLSELYQAYNEAAVARTAVDTLRRTADLAADSLRLVNLRYEGGSSTVLDVVDAETTLTQSRNAYDDAQVRYRMALATLQTFTGSF
jgi:outer membrane protein TolC